MMTIWHLFSAICLITATASALGAAKSQHTSVAAYGLCILVGILLGFITAFGNLSCAKIARKLVRDQRQSMRIAMLSLLLVASLGWIVLADLSGRWISVALLHMFLH